jgi:hypothetical protein
MAKKPVQSATMKNQQAPAPTGPLKCGDTGTYRELKKRKTNKQERDHIPATSSMLAAAEKKITPAMTTDQIACFKRWVKMDALTVAIPKGIHVEFSRTCKGRGGQQRIDDDADDLKDAAEKDFADVQPQLSDDCQKKYEAAKKAILAQLPDKFIDECKARAIKEC